jgi:hypothetical protein
MSLSATTAPSLAAFCKTTGEVQQSLTKAQNVDVAGEGSQETLRWKAESTANSSLEHVQVGGQAIEAPNRGEGAKKKRRINPVHQLSPRKNDGLSGARQVSVTAQGNQPGTPGGSRKSRTRDAYSTQGRTARDGLFPP